MKQYNGRIAVFFLMMVMVALALAFFATNTKADIIIPEGCPTYNVSESASPIIESWSIEEDPCLALVFDTPGTMNITGGWVFIPDVTLDRFVGSETISTVLETYVNPNELAAQISPLSTTVAGGETWILRPNKNEFGSEIGFWWNFEVEEPTPTPIPTPEPSSMLQVYMPLIVENQQSIQTFEVEEGGSEQIFSYVWGSVVPSSKVCVNLKFENIGAGENAILTRGWYFGQLTSLTLEVNGQPVEITGIEQPGELAWQIPETSLPTVQNAQICVQADGNSAEIGLVVRFPN